MKVLVIGASGMLGHKLIQSWSERFEVWTTLKGNFTDYEKFGIFDKKRTLSLVDAEKFETVENALLETYDTILRGANEIPRDPFHK